ncbi:alpha/beta fold hydrolase [Amycolatopsis alkalitolerans]|uniref:Alpha/beta fold hydrolase n=1 Tax=Amycolatopsis alkalitolerans TaxID=2547244 RepID=A0A5C4M2F0_9PSEU|nr:alpha/beta fold hydrolase [Amycolatopsis alkalitolerans]TNC25070.1 alpha/beta fold hydrolase [Amycolatopsis alkalitolerans]
MTALAYSDEGSGPAVLLAASLGTTRAMWEPQRSRIREERRVISFDHRGHGESPSPAGPYTLADLVTDTVTLLDSLSVESVDVVGVSLGGTVGLALAADHPDRVRSLVTINSPVFADEPEFWRRRAIAVRRDGMTVASNGLLSRWYSPAAAATPSMLVASTVSGVDRLDPEGYAGCCEAIAGTDLRDRIGEVRCPVLVVDGLADAVVPAHHAELIAATVPGARRVRLPGAGHLLTQEGPDELHELLTGHWNHQGVTS